jgi:hypothetical protein
MNILPFVLILTLLCSLAITGQNPPPDDPVCTANFSQLVIGQQIDDSRNVDARKRVKILIRAADFLWKIDEEMSRRYFTEGYAKATEHFNEKGFEIAKRDPEQGGLFNPLSDLRTDVIRAVAKHDSEWARDLTSKLMAEYDKARNDRKDDARDKEPAELLMMASETSKTDPGFAMFLFRLAMRYPLNSTWYFVLYSAARANQAMGDQVYAEALFNYRNEAPSKLLFLSAYPFGTVRIMGSDRFSFGSSVPTGFSPNASLQRQFISTFFDRVTAIAADPSVFQPQPANSYPAPEPVFISSALSDIEPLVISDFPDLMGRLGIVRSLAAALLNDDLRERLGGSDRFRNSVALTFEERIKKATEDDSNGKLADEQIIGLITFENMSEAQFKLVEPFLAKIKDEKLRPEAVSHFWSLRTDKAITDRRFEDAERHSKRVPELDHRSVLMFRLVEAQSKDSMSASSAFDNLNALSKLARSAPNSVAKAHVLLGLSTYYTKLNRGMAIDELSEAVRVINSLPEGADLLSTQVVRQLRSKNGSHFAVVPLPGANLETVFSELSKEGVEVPLATARGINDRYFRILAVLAIAKNCADEVKRKAAETRSNLD